MLSAMITLGTAGDFGTESSDESFSLGDFWTETSGERFSLGDFGTETSGFSLVFTRLGYLGLQQGNLELQQGNL